MATYNVLCCTHRTLTANVVDTVNISNSQSYVRVTNRNALNDLYCRVDGTDPTVLGDNSFVVQQNQEKVFGVPDTANPQVRLISSFGVAYSVEPA